MYGMDQFLLLLKIGFCTFHRGRCREFILAVARDTLLIGRCRCGEVAKIIVNQVLQKIIMTVTVF